MKTKQVLVMRRDLNMRKGKLVAQGSHAAMAFLTEAIRNGKRLEEFSPEEKDWITGRFTKICVYVNSEEQLEQIAKKAEEEGLLVKRIIDSGLTEFKGEPTFTCIGIGPDNVEKIDKITGDLPLL